MKESHSNESLFPRFTHRSTLTSQQDFLHALTLRRTVPFAMTKLILALAKAQAYAFGDLFQERSFVAAVLPTNVVDLVRNLLCFAARLHRIE